MRPGESAEYYEKYANQVSPYLSLAFSFPAFYLLPRLVFKSNQENTFRNGAIAVSLYAATDITISLLFEGFKLTLLPLFFISILLKLVAVFLASNKKAQV